MTPDVVVRDVGPRDGLQVEAPVEPERRVALVDGLVGAGLRAVEAVAFVSPARVPSMAGAAQVMAGLSRSPGVVYHGLVPNLRGAELAEAAGVDAVTVTLSASETYSRKNVGRSRPEAEADTFAILEHLAGRLPVDVVVSCAFGSPYGEAIDTGDVADLAGRLRAAGATVTLADTTGEAMPRRLEEMIAAVGAGVGLHLHDSRHTALLNAYVALQCGVRRFDASVGGLGGSPFADGAAGNLATEDLVHLADDLGLATGVDLSALLQVSRGLAELVGHPVPAVLAATGPAGGAGRGR